VPPGGGRRDASFRAGEVNNNEQTARYSFIPSAGAPAYLTEDNVVGQVAPAEFNGLKVGGSYGPAWVISAWELPPGYAVCFYTFRAGSVRRVVALREHPNYKGLLVIAGRPAFSAGRFVLFPHGRWRLLAAWRGVRVAGV
jgi:hypothetical protein